MDTQPLEYQTPRFTSSPTRKLTSRHASRNAGGCLVLALVFAIVAWIAFRVGGVKLSFFPIAVAVCEMTGGIIYLIASVQIIRPNPFWESALMWTACLHALAFAVLVCLAVAVCLGAFAAPPAPATAILGSVCCLTLLAAHVLAFLRMAYLARKLRRGS